MICCRQLQQSFRAAGGGERDLSALKPRGPLDLCYRAREAMLGRCLFGGG